MADQQAIEKQIILVLSEVIEKPGTDFNVNEDIDKLGMDSIDNLDVMMKLEDFFNIEFDTAKFSQLNTIRDVTNEIASLIEH